VERTLGTIDPPALHLYRYLWQGGRGGTRENISPFGRIEDRAVTWAQKLPVLICHRAPLVGAHGRVGREPPVWQVDEHRGVARVRETRGRARWNSGGPSDLLASHRPLSTRDLGELVAIGGPVGGPFRGLLSASGERRGSGDAHTQCSPESNEPLARDLTVPFLQGTPFVSYRDFARCSNPPTRLACAG
jgi:hypothetical protein